MDRRAFFSFLGRATAGAVVAYSFPSIIVPKNIQPVIDGYLLAPRGLAYLINDQSRILQGVSTISFKPQAIPAQFFDYAQQFLNEMYYKTSLVTDF